MFVTNFFVTRYDGAIDAINDDAIKYVDKTNTWANFTPNTKTTGERIFTARIIVPFKDRLVFLNTVEQNSGHTTNTQYQNRCRFSWNGDPTSPYAFLEPNQANAGGGGFIDAPTQAL